MFNAGVWGRLYVSGTGNFAGIKSMELDGETAEIPIPHFESYVDANNRIWPAYLLGLSGATGTLEGYFNSIAPIVVNDASAPITDSVLSNGFAATIKIFTDRRGNWGYALNVYITGFRVVVNEENQPVGFTARFRVNEAVPLSAVV